MEHISLPADAPFSLINSRRDKQTIQLKLPAQAELLTFN